MASFLIIDGDRNFRETLAIALRLDGHEAVVAPDPEAALALLETRGFGCCVVDSHLPAADELLAAADRTATPAFATGRYAEVLAATAARHPGARTIAKPFRASDLVARARPGANAA